MKRNRGIDNEDIQGVKQLISWKPKEIEIIVHRALYSAADEFTDDCEELVRREANNSNSWCRCRKIYNQPRFFCPLPELGFPATSLC